MTKTAPAAANTPHTNPVLAAELLAAGDATAQRQPDARTLAPSAVAFARRHRRLAILVSEKYGALPATTVTQQG